MVSDVTAQRYSAGGPRIAGLLSLATEQAMAAINGEVSRHPALGLAHLQIFRFGSIEGRRVTELATLMRMTKQSMHELVGHLERHGYLRREPDPTDARARLIRMTELGVEFERQMVPRRGYTWVGTSRSVLSASHTCGRRYSRSPGDAIRSHSRRPAPPSRPRRHPRAATRAPISRNGDDRGRDSTSQLR